MTERIITDSNGRKHITNEPQLHPPKRTWVGLTQEEVQEIHDTYYRRMGRQEFAAMVEAKLKEKNND